MRGHRRPDLQLPAVHDPADLRQPGEDRPAADRGGGRISTAARCGAFAKVVLPLSLPGVFAGSLLTFIPAAGDFINAELLGSPNQQMIGTVIQNQFLEVRDYPLAASLSFVLMAVITIGVLALRPGARHRGPGLMAGRPRCADGSLDRLRRCLRRAGPALSLPADLRHRALQLQQAGGQVQLRLEVVLARGVARPVQVSGRWSTR